MPTSYRFEIPPGGIASLGGELRRLAERLAMEVSDQAAQKALRNIRSDMAGARLGRLGQAITMTSDKRKGGRLYRQGDVARASGIIYIRSKSPRTVGAIISYTEGAQMAAKNPSGYMWYPLDAAFRIARLPIPRHSKGRPTIGVRLTPSWWRRTMEPKLGPLFRVRGSDGNPLLVVRNVGVSAVAGVSKRPRSLTKSGRPRKGDVLATIVPIFKGIRATSRAARVFPQRRAFEAMQQAAAELRGV